MITSHTRQYLLNTFTLRLAQIFFDFYRYYPLYKKQNLNQQPFFIIGSGRSGTTLLRSFLFNHKDLDIPPETDGFIPNSVKKFYRYGGLDWKDLVNVIIGEFCSLKEAEYWNIDVLSVQKRLYELSQEDRTLYNIINELYREHIAEHKPNSKRWGDKSPFNTLRLQWIDRVFPQAQYINLIRDGRAVVSSYLRSGLITDIGKACDRWTRSIEYAEKFASSKSSKYFLTVYYENLVKDPEIVIKKICNYLNIPYSDSLLERENRDLNDLSMDHMKNVKKNVFQKSITKWKNHLSEEQISFIEKTISFQLEKHNYSS